VLHGQSYKDSQTARSPFVFICVQSRGVRLCKAGDRSIDRVTKDLDHTKTALRSTATYVAELVRLRRENKQLLMDREILKTAAKFFAKQSP
jgi:transposase